MPAIKTDKKTLDNLKDFFIYLSILIIIILSFANINKYLTPKEIKVLGVSTQNSSLTFWQEFLARNPSYIPGWIETGRTDKATDIDPNYLYK